MLAMPHSIPFRKSFLPPQEKIKMNYTDTQLLNFLLGYLPELTASEFYSLTDCKGFTRETIAEKLREEYGNEQINVSRTQRVLAWEPKAPIAPLELKAPQKASLLQCCNKAFESLKKVYPDTYRQMVFDDHSALCANWRPDWDKFMGVTLYPRYVALADKLDNVFINYCYEQVEIEDRTKFESWAESKGLDCTRNLGDPQTYLYDKTQTAWQAFQAALNGEE